MKKDRAEALQEKLAAIHQKPADFDNEITYIFENHKPVDFSLPKKSICGKKMIPPKGRFRGDEYFITFVKSGDLRLVDTIHPKPKTLNENAGASMEKLILDQPERFTNQGKTENVVVTNNPKQVLNDNNNPNPKQQDVLLVESPMEGIDIIEN